MSGFSNETVAARMSLEHSPRGGVFGIGHANTGQAQSVCCQVSGKDLSNAVTWDVGSTET